MESPIIVVSAVMLAASVYLLLSSNVIRLVLGVALLSNGVHLSIFAAGRVTREVPPIVPHGLELPAEMTANPLPQALILTAIVISFALLAFILVLTFRSYQALGTDNAGEMRVAEPVDRALPPAGY
jgi:multicomponent Na+:H+ antiporter subunit C